jgi:hypothetical protein
VNNLVAAVFTLPLSLLYKKGMFDGKAEQGGYDY